MSIYTAIFLVKMLYCYYLQASLTSPMPLYIDLCCYHYLLVVQVEEQAVLYLLSTTPCTLWVWINEVPLYTPWPVFNKAVLSWWSFTQHKINNSKIYNYWQQITNSVMLCCRSTSAVDAVPSVIYSVCCSSLYCQLHDTLSPWYALQLHSQGWVGLDKSPSSMSMLGL